MGNAMKLQVRAFCRAIVQKNHRAGASEEELFEGQNLSTITQGTLCQETQFRQ